MSTPSGPPAAESDDQDPTLGPRGGQTRNHLGSSGSATPSSAGNGGRERVIALVLGAGGSAGHAFHSGVLAALADHGGWDARHAELIIGTSAGSGVSALLRGGMSPADIYAHQRGRALSAEGQEVVDRLPLAPWDSGDIGDHRVLPASAPLALRGLLRWPPRPGVSLTGLLPRGARSSQPLGDRYGALHSRWPDRTLWLVAVRMRDGKRVVFGRDDHPPLNVGTAVQASSAIPGFFTPIRLDNNEYVDGGVWSATNADLVNGLGFDALVVSAPLAGPFDLAALRRQFSARNAARAYHRATLHDELRQVRRAGTPVISFEAGPEHATLLANNNQRAGGGTDIAEAAYASVLQRLETDPSLVELLNPRVPA
ncbi:MAG: patatin-like phospholipase family protein [Acidimicrobiales bacterium]